MNTLSSSKEIRYMNLAKALGIIAVVIGHSIPYSRIINFIYLYHMPLFYFITGYFYKDKYSHNPWEFVKRKICSLYIPFIKYELLLLALHNIFFYFGVYSISDNHIYSYKDYIENAQNILNFYGTEQMAFTFWFIPSLFITSILFCVISHISLKKNHIELCRFSFITILYITGFFITSHKLILHWNANSSLIALPIFYLGYLYKKYEININLKMYYLVPAFTILFLCSRWKIDMNQDVFINPLFFICNSIAGIYINIYCSRLIIKNIAYVNHLLYIGKHTIIIMALQFMGFWIGRNIVKFIDPLIKNGALSQCTWIIISLCGLYFPLAIQYLGSQLKNLSIDFKDILPQNI